MNKVILRRFLVLFSMLILSISVSAKIVGYRLLYGTSKSVCQAVSNDLRQSIENRDYIPFSDPPFSIPKWRQIQYVFKKGDRQNKRSGEYSSFDIDNDGVLDHVLRYFTYPNRTVAENILLLADHEMKGERNAVIDFTNTFRNRPKLLSQAHYKVDESLLRQENPDVQDFGATTFYLGALQLKPFFFDGVSYIVLQKMYPDQPNPDSSWLIVGMFSKEPRDDESLQRFVTINPTCYFLGVIERLMNPAELIER